MKKKLAIIIASLTSIVVLAGVISDMKFYSDDFMNKQGSNVISRRLDDSLERTIASNYKYRPQLINLPVNADNRSRINGFWRVTKYTFNFDKGEKMNIKVRFELVGNAQIMVGNDQDQIFGVTYLSTNNRIRIIKELKNGHEILEAEKIQVNKASAAEVKSQDNQEMADQKAVQEEIYQEMADLVLESAINPAKSNKKLPNTTGEVLLSNKEIENLNVSVDGISIQIPTAEIKVGGIFNTEIDGEPVSGRYSNQNGHKIRFFTGPLAGVILNFVTSDELYQLQKEAEEQAFEKERIFGNEAVYDRTQEVEVKEEITSEAEMQEKAEEAGFDFSQNN